MSETLQAFILAGGEGKRLMPLTQLRAKPAMPFGANYRLIDFPLDNLRRAEEIIVLTQYEPESLRRHISRHYKSDGLDVLSPKESFGVDIERYQGTADAIFQNLHRIRRTRADNIGVFSADHVFLEDVQEMLSDHMHRGFDLTISAMKLRTDNPENYEQKAGKTQFRFGVIIADAKGRIIDFQEKPEKPQEIAGEPGFVWVSMGNYLFRRGAIYEGVKNAPRRKVRGRNGDAEELDFGKDVIPFMKTQGLVLGIHPTSGYWSDVGDTDSLYRANLDLCQDSPKLNLWEIYRARQNVNQYATVLGRTNPPVKMRSGDTWVVAGEGSILEGMVKNSVIGKRVIIETGARVEDSIIFDNSVIRRGAVVQRTIIDKHRVINERETVGTNRKADAKRGYVFDEKSQVTVVPRGTPEYGILD